VSEPARRPLHTAVPEVYRAEIGRLHDSLYDERKGREVMATIRALTESIVLTPLDGELRIDPRGDIEGDLALAAGKQRGAPEVRDASEQVKLVAGTGFEPVTFRL